MLQVLRQAVVAVLPDGPVTDGALRQGDRQGLQGLHQPCLIWLSCCPIRQVWQLAQWAGVSAGACCSSAKAVTCTPMTLDLEELG